MNLLKIGLKWVELSPIFKLLFSLQTEALAFWK